MAHWRVSGMLLSVACALVVTPSQAGALRCGDRLASTGSSLYEVQATCGDPDDAQHSVETRIIQQRVLVPCFHGGERRLCETFVEQAVEVAVDRWTYDFGSNRFLEFARFEQGVLVNVTSGGYGHKDPT
jgi:hypothetical protein